MNLKLGLIGTGMFGGDVHARAYADLQRAGISPHLGRLGFDAWARELAPVKFELAALAARSERSARQAQQDFKRWTGCEPKPYWGAEPWVDVLHDFPDLDVVAVATPDPLHTPVILAALKAGAHVFSEKPLCLDIHEADEIIALAEDRDRIVALDMHKRYDPDHRQIAAELKERIGEPLYGLAYLEEPLHVSARTFQWTALSDPFSYVGSHWVDLIYHYYHSKPVSLTAVGQKRRLVREGINAYDALQVRVDFENGMSFAFHNNWITPPDFEGQVNQGHEIVGTEGKVESDQQQRGLRWWSNGAGSRTANNHFTRDVSRPDGSRAYVGYGLDSVYASLVAISRFKFFGATRAETASLYPTVEEGRISVAILHAARLVCDLNFKYLREGKGATACARFGPEGITIIDPNRAGEGPGRVFHNFYQRPI